MKVQEYCKRRKIINGPLVLDLLQACDAFYESVMGDDQDEKGNPQDRMMIAAEAYEQAKKDRGLE